MRNNQPAAALRVAATNQEIRMTQNETLNVAETRLHEALDAIRTAKDESGRVKKSHAEAAVPQDKLE